MSAGVTLCKLSWYRQWLYMVDEDLDSGLKFARQVVILQQQPFLRRLMPAFNLALRHRMIGAPVV